MPGHADCFNTLTYINMVDILLNGKVPTGVNVGSLTSKKPRIYQ